jgi:hypothetical protein
MHSYFQKSLSSMINRSFIVLLLVFTLILSNSVYSQMYVSPDGDDANPGTIELPFKSISKATSLAGPDSVIYLRGGVYYDSTTIRLNKSGQPGRYIKLWAYPGERPIIDFEGQPVSTSSRGFQLSHNYWHLKGLEIRHAKDNGIYISAWYSIVENCIIYRCNDTGIQISNGGSYNKIINCDSFENYDPLTFGENADGFAAKLNIGPGNEFYGCRAWLNADDGWDLYQAGDSVYIEDCWAFRNGFNIWGIPNFQGDGNGFKLGGNYTADPHKIVRSVAFDNKSKGFDQNNNTAGIAVYNNTAFRNQSRNFSFPAAPSSGKHELKNNLSYLGQNLTAAGSILETNSWQGFTVSDTDFISLDTSLAVIEREISGILQEIDLFRLRKTSSLVDAGVNVGLPFNDSAPDIGAFETDGEPADVKDEYIVSSFILHQNYPNPFNPSTIFSFSLLSPGDVSLDIYDILGRKTAVVFNGYLQAGSYNIDWNASAIPAGVYFAEFRYMDNRKVIKLNLIK